MSDPELDESTPRLLPARPRRKRAPAESVPAAPLPPAPEAAPRRRRRRPAFAPPVVERLHVTWKTGKAAVYEGQNVQYLPGFLVIQTMTADYRILETHLATSEMRSFTFDRQWEPPRVADTQRWAGIPQNASMPNVPPPPQPAPSVMHVSPGMATRKGAGRTIVTPDGQTATQTPEGDIIGAALFAAGMPPGRIAG